MAWSAGRVARVRAVQFLTILAASVACGIPTSASQPAANPTEESQRDPARLAPALSEVRTATPGPEREPADKERTDLAAVAPATSTPMVTRKPSPSPTQQMNQRTLTRTPTATTAPTITLGPSPTPLVEVTEWDMGPAFSMNLFEVTESSTVFQRQDEVHIMAWIRVETESDVKIEEVWRYENGEVELELWSEIDSGEWGWHMYSEPPPAGWRVGSYEVELYIDGRLIQTWTFRVAGN